jgi:hypothetical protein
MVVEYRHHNQLLKAILCVKLTGGIDAANDKLNPSPPTSLRYQDSAIALLTPRTNFLLRNRVHALVEFL